MMNPQEKTIVIIGPRARVSQPQRITINTTSHGTDWQSDLSPFKLGPAKLWDGRTSVVFDNAWQFSKVYLRMLGPDRRPNPEWYQWSERGFTDEVAHRYPMGKGAKPEGSWWNNQLLGYIDARKHIYLPLYRDLVRQTEGWEKLKSIYQTLLATQGMEARLQLWDFDAYDHHGAGLSLREVLNNSKKIMGHGFILAQMLIYGEDVTEDTLP
jgi:hypothetical protein